MNIKLQSIDPINYPGWDHLLMSVHDHSFFHSSSWAKVICKSYGYNPLYFTLIENGQLSVLIPMMEIKSIITGKRGVSIPFSDDCEPVVSEENCFTSIFNRIIDYGKNSGWRYIEMRGGGKFFQNISPYSRYNIYKLDLDRTESNIFSSFRGSTKRNIRKADREGVKAAIFNSLEAMKEFYRLQSITRKHHGLPPQPFHFFKNIFDHIIFKNKGNIFLARYKSKVIAGGIYLHIGKSAIYKYGASDRDYQHLRANNSVMWEAIRWYSQNGYKTFDMGRTEPDNKGLNQFKAGWGTRKKEISYYKYDLGKRRFMVKDSSGSLLHNLHKKFFHHLPVSSLKVVGTLAYKHIG